MNMLLYPIRAVSKLTGISIDTLRAWERRHNVVTPQRDERGRLYSDADVHRLRLLSAAVEKGHAISRLASLNDEELQTLIANPVAAVSAALAMETAHADEFAPVPRSVMSAIERMDYLEAERELSLLAAVLSPRDLVHRVALPLMREVGDGWHLGTLSVAQEHMASSLLRNLFGALIPQHQKTAPTSKLLFVTPSGEQHEFGILASAMLAVGGGLGAIYLGTNLPAEEIVQAAQKTAPQAVILGFIGANGAKAGITEIHKVAQNLPSHIELWVGGTQADALIEEVRKTRAVLIENFEMLEQHLVRLGARF
ncbi:MAG: MerR family transcriptional regulator [Acidobacteria bacterium]|nr:MerR family transcriptional regulator [Acidobacteriota bacterium]